MTNDQGHRIRKWLTQHKADLNGLFIVSPLVFTHAAPSIDAFAVSIWPTVMKGVDWLAQKFEWGKSLQRSFKESLDDIRDNIGDAWGAPENNAQADLILDFMFENIIPCLSSF